jgi:hypothetical protein
MHEMKIEYEICNYITEKLSFEIENEKNCFLQGKSRYDNRQVWFGIWTGEDNRLHIVTLYADKIEFASISSGYVTLDIKKFL